jgi:hypothetical protein
MKRSEFERFCLVCAEGLETRYGEALVGEVRTALWGGSRSGSAKHMDIATGITEITAIASLLVSMLGTVVAFVQLRVSTSEKAKAGSAEAADSRKAPLSFSADVAAIERSLDEVISDLSAEQQSVARVLAQEICAWMTSCSNR